MEKDIFFPLSWKDPKIIGCKRMHVHLSLFAHRLTWSFRSDPPEKLKGGPTYVKGAYSQLAFWPSQFYVSFSRLVISIKFSLATIYTQYIDYKQCCHLLKLVNTEVAKQSVIP